MLLLPYFSGELFALQAVIAVNFRHVLRNRFTTVAMLKQLVIYDSEQAAVYSVFQSLSHCSQRDSTSMDTGGKCKIMQVIVPGITVMVLNLCAMYIDTCCLHSTVVTR